MRPLAKAMNMTETRSTCPYCGVGCGVIIESEGDQITGVRGDPDHPANFGRLCTKGSTLHLTAAEHITRQARLLQPQVRPARGQPPQPLTWDAALGLAAQRFADVIDTHGPNAVGFYLSGQLLTEDYYVFNKIAKGLIGTNNVDTNSRLCMSSAVAGYKRTLGADAPPACYDDLAEARCLFIAGSNTAHAHPIVFRRIEDARRAHPDMKIIVVDPRRTDTAALADLHLMLQPGTDVLLFNGLLHLMLAEGLIDQAYIARHTTGFETLAEHVSECTSTRVALVCGVREDDLHTAARWFATSPATLSLYCQGLNQSSSGTAKNTALINLHLATGHIGRPGAGPFSLTGQSNAMGGREVGGMANLLSAHRDLANPTHRAEVARLWGVEQVPATPGKTALEMFQAAADGEIKALWIACTNPAQSLPDQAAVRRALQRAEFVVVQDCFRTTATCAYADLLLPATTWGEKSGTVTNSERRISRVRRAVPPPGQARDDWAIGVGLAQALEKRLRPGQPTLFPYQGPEDIWNEHRESTRGRDLDITGLSYTYLEQAGPQQWPFPSGAAQGQPRLYTDGCFPTPDGKARFETQAWQTVAEPRDQRYPVSLTTGRLRDQWHGMSRTGTLGRLFGHVPEPVLQLQPEDMRQRGLVDGDWVHVTSRRGSLVLPAQGSEELGASQAFMAMHWGSEYLGGTSNTGHALGGVNTLTPTAACPQSRQPELKHTAVKVLKAELPWSLLAMAWVAPDEALNTREALQALMPRFAFATCVPFGHQRTGVLLRAAAYAPPEDETLARIEALLGLRDADVLRYTDRRQGHTRAMKLHRDLDNTWLQAFVLAGDTRAERWLKPLLQDERPVQAYGRQLLTPGATPPLAQAARSRLICTCLHVDETAILSQLPHCAGIEDDRLAALQHKRKRTVIPPLRAAA